MAATYKWVDSQGVTHYSDRPVAGAEVVDVEELSTYTRPPRTSAPVTPAASASSAAASSGAQFRYARCAITAPSADEVFQNSYTVSISWTLSPTLRPGDSIRLIYDGQIRGDVGPAALGTTISPIDRGTHTVLINVEDPNGVSLCRSAEVTFHVRQPSLLAPPRRNETRPR